MTGPIWKKVLGIFEECAYLNNFRAIKIIRVYLKIKWAYWKSFKAISSLCEKNIRAIWKPFWAYLKKKFLFVKQKSGLFEKTMGPFENKSRSI